MKRASISRYNALFILTLLPLLLASQATPLQAQPSDLQDLLDAQEKFKNVQKKNQRQTINKVDQSEPEKKSAQEKGQKARNATQETVEVSNLEKSYRLQYGDALVEQQIRLEEFPYRKSRRYQQEKLNKLLANKNQTEINATKQALFPEEWSPGNRTRIQFYPYISKFKERTTPINLKKIINTQLRQYGYDFFQDVSPEAQKNFLPDQDYRLVPGDFIQIRIWGNENQIDFKGKIQSDGTVFIPKIGVLTLAGVKYGNLQKVLAKEAKKYLQGVKINAVLKEPADLQVFFAGHLKNPGLHTVPPFSSMISALSQIGGIKKQGSLRNIQLFRNGTLHKELDLYELIQHGKNGHDVILKDQDVIFVPSIGPTFAVAGAAVNPGIYELKSKRKNQTSVYQALQMAGGALPQADSQIYVRKFSDNSKMQMNELSLQEDRIKETKIQPGSLIELRYFHPKNTRSVKLQGHIWNPKEVSYHQGLKLSDILQDDTDLKPGAITDYAVIKRYLPQEAEFTTIKFPLKKVIKGKYDQELQPSDKIQILSKKDFGRTQPVFINGAVWKPGEYEFESNLTIEGLLAKAGGLRFGANTDKIHITSKFKTEEKIINKQRKIDLTTNDKIRLKPYDSVTIPQMKDSQNVKRFEITGEVNNPGNYTITENINVSDLITKAGGFTEQAYFYGAEYTSEDAKEIQQNSIDKMVQKLQIQLRQNMASQAQTAVSQEAIQATRANVRAAQKIIEQLKQIEAEGRIAFKLTSLDTFQGSQYDFPVENGDSLHIPKKPNFVSVVGSVYSPSSYLYTEDATVESYLKKSGGITERGDEAHIYVLKANGEVVSAPGINSWFSDIYDHKLRPGDTVVVPEDLERIPYLRMIKDVTDIVFKIATTAGVAMNFN